MKIKFRKKGLLIISVLFFFFSFGFAINTQADTTTITPPSFIPSDGSSDTTIIDPPSTDPSSPTYAGKLNGDTKTNLERWKDDLEVANNPITNVFRGLGWWFIIQTGNIVNGINGATQNTYDVLNIYGSDTNPGPLQKVISGYEPLFIGIGVLVFVVMTIGILFSKNIEVVSILKNMLLGVSIMVFLPFVFGQLTSLSTSFSKLVTTSNNSGYAVIDQNVTDLYAIDSNYQWNLPDGESIETQESKQNFFEKPTKSVLQGIDINDTLDASKLSSTGKNIAENALVTNEKGKVEVKSLNDATNNNWFKSLITGDSAYYRYHVNFFTIIFYNLLVLIITAFLLYKLINIMIEIVITAGILQATAITDTKGKRNWEILSKLFSLFSSIIMVVFLEVVFAKGYAVTSTLKGGAIVQAIAGIALAFAIIKGPNIFQSTFGIDSGLSHGFRDMMTFTQSTMMLKGGLGLAGKATETVASTAGKAGKGALGAVAKLSDKVGGKAGNIAEEMAKQSEALNTAVNAGSNIASNLSQNNQESPTNQNLSSQEMSQNTANGLTNQDVSQNVNSDLNNQELSQNNANGFTNEEMSQSTANGLTNQELSQSTANGVNKNDVAQNVSSDLNNQELSQNNQTELSNKELSQTGGIETANQSQGANDRLKTANQSASAPKQDLLAGKDNSKARSFAISNLNKTGTMPKNQGNNASGKGLNKIPTPTKTPLSSQSNPFTVAEPNLGKANASTSSSPKIGSSLRGLTLTPKANPVASATSMDSPIIPEPTKAPRKFSMNNLPTNHQSNK